MTERERASGEFGLRANGLFGALAFALDVVLPLEEPMRAMRPFRHTCAPCETCGSSGTPDCPECGGQSTACDCEAAYDYEADLRYRLAREEGR